MPFEIRLANSLDEPFLWQMLYEAAHMAAAGESLEGAKFNPALACYVENWGMPNDIGVLVVNPDSQQPIAAIWMRLFQKDHRGYGYINDQIPELAMATAPEFRGMGAGTQLMQALIELVKDKYPAIGLNVRADNEPALKLYRKFGFQPVPGSEIINRVGGRSFNMILKLQGEPIEP